MDERDINKLKAIAEAPRVEFLNRVDAKQLIAICDLALQALRRAEPIGHLRRTPNGSWWFDAPALINSGLFQEERTEIPIYITPPEAPK